MTHVIADRVKETTTTEGVGPLALLGAVLGYRRLSAVPAIAVGDTAFYTAEAVDGSGALTGEWEVGLGTYSAANTLTRTTIIASSNAGAAVAFGPGTKNVFITVPSTQAAWIRERLLAPRTYYVRTDGNDSNTGLVNTAGGAFLTLQKAATLIERTLDLAGQTVTVQVADGTYTGGVLLPNYVGGGSVSFEGNAGAPANVLISTTGTYCFGLAAPRKFTLSGFKLQTTTAGNGIRATDGGRIDHSNMNFGVCAQAHVRVTYGAIVAAVGNYTISGSAPSHIEFTEGGNCACSDRTLTLTGTPNFPAAFVFGRGPSNLLLNTITFIGAATGVRYNLINGASCYVAGASSTYLPGNSAGTITAGGIYG